MKQTPLAIAISIALANGSLLMSTPLLAQEEDDAAQETIEEVITTGSRIKKDAFTSSAPMDIIDVDKASVQGIANVGELLRRNTAAAGSPQVTSATSAEFVQNGGLGANTLSLRGLGANRTLVLINGRRPGPAGTRGAVSSFDLNILPLATIERVEILKDGASSIYGSDAVAGVVNIITRKDDGGIIDGFISQPDDSGGEESRLSATWGKNFDRGSFRVTADYHKQSELARGDRDYFTCGNQYIFDQATGDRADSVDPRTGEFACRDLVWGHIWLYNQGADNLPSGPAGENYLAQYDFDGDLAQYIPAYGAAGGPGDLVTSPGWFPVGYDRASDGVTNRDHPFQDQESLVPETENTTFYAEAEFELSDSVEAYGEVLLNRRTTYHNAYRQYWAFAVYSGNFDFYDYGGSESTADAGWFGDFFFSPTAITDHSDTEVEVDYQRVVGGLRGEFGNTSWTWDTSFSYNSSDGDYTEDQIYQDSIFDSEWRTGPGPRDPGFDYAAMANGSGTCVGTVSSVRGAPCVDIPWLSQDLMNGVFTPELRDFMLGVETGNTKYTQWSIDGSATGEVFDMPAGPLSAAVGFHYREDEIDDLPGEITLASNTWGSSAAGNTKGKDDTTAVFVELDVPLLSDTTIAKNLTLNASARYTDVSSYGDDTTWKVGINWQILDSLRIRANQGTSFRTPALFELYLADQTSFADQRIDPCRDWGQNLANGTISQTIADNCAADQSSIGGPAGGFAADYTGGTITPTVFTGGGFGVLEAETSKSKTLGMIWQPAFANLSASIDYFEITVRDEVDQLGAGTIVYECYASSFGFASGATEPLCNQFDRSSANFGVDNVRDSYLNIAEQTNRGFDYAVQYDTEAGSLGALSFEMQATRQLEDTRAYFAETAEDLSGWIGDPEWVGEFNVSLMSGPWSFYYGGNYIGTTDSTDDLGQDFVTYFGVDYDAVISTDPVIYHNFSVSYDWDDMGVRLLLGVSNFTAEEPPQVTTTGTGGVLDAVGNSAFYSQYDWFGRRVFLNATMSFD
jgi:iron complex outermembrane receptor protein